MITRVLATGLHFTALAAVLAACTQRDATPPFTFTSTDSAGVRIVTSNAPQWTSGSAWKLSESPVLTIGGTDGDTLYEFNSIESVHRLTDGSFAIATSKPHIVRYYSADGRFVRQIGRKGEGPAEYGSIQDMLRLPGDSLLTIPMVSMTRKVLLFAPDGKFARRVKLESISRNVGEGAHSVIPAGVFGDGSFLAEATVFQGGRAHPSLPEPPDGLYADSVEFHHFSRDGQHLHSLGTFDKFERLIAKGEHYIRGHSPQRVFAMRGDTFITGNGATFEIRAYTFDGTLRAITRIETPPVQYTADSIAKRHASGLARAKTPEQRRFVEQIHDVMRWPTVLPRFEEIIADDDGTLWVREYNTVSPNRWYVISADGVWLGNVELPARFAMKGVAAGAVYGVALDSNDVESVRVFSILRS